MTFSRIRWTLLSTASLVAMTLVSESNAKDELPKPVRKVLSVELQVSDSNWNRRQQLGEELIKAKNTEDELHWHAGFVKLNGKWLPFEEAITPEPVSGDVREYLDRRVQSEHTWQSQSRLASWCRKHGMGEQNQAHLYHAMMFSPKSSDFGQLYQRMGYVQVGSQWLSRQEAFEAQRDLVEYLEQLESGTPAVSRFADELEANRLSEMSRRDRLKQFATPKKIAALEMVLSPRSERSGQAAVEALRQIPSYQASQALGRIAVYSPWLFVRDSAIDGLQDRRWEDFVPQWLSMMRMPIATEYQRVTWGRHLGILCLFHTERNSEVEVMQFLAWAPNSNRPTTSRSDAARLTAYQDQVLRRLRGYTITAERLNLVRTDEAEQLNERIFKGLETVTGEEPQNTTKDWWDWWQEQNGLPTISTGAKPVVVVVKEDTQVNVPPPPRPTSCLVAGTPIWTERGLVPVERIQTGDRVLSKNIETGELGYKIVLHTTVREPSPVTKFVVGEETIQATEAHHFWVSGRGWTKTRELAAEQPLHTPIGVTRVVSTESAEPAPTYNLVVADFHTYFVGKSAILSHDVLPPKPTNKRVPGLDDD